MSSVEQFHRAVRAGDVDSMRSLLAADPALVNAKSETDARGTYPLHVAAEFNQAAAAQLLVEHGADVSLLDTENAAIALGWAAFFGRPAVVEVLLRAGSEINQRNSNGLTATGCAAGGAKGQWQKFSNASLEDWQAAEKLLRGHGGEP